MAIFDRIRLIRMEHGLSQEAFANSIGLKRANYAQIEAGNQNPTIPVIIEIVRIYNKTYEWLLEGVESASNNAPIAAPNCDKKEVDNTISSIPQIIIVDSNDIEQIALVPASEALVYLKSYQSPDYIKSLSHLVIPGFASLSHRAFEVTGQSMLPAHHSGSIAIGRSIKNFDEIRDRSIYIVVTKTNGIMLKRVLNRIKEDGKLILISDNEDKIEFPNYAITAEDVLELWYWRGSIIRESPEPGGVYTRLNDMDSRLTLLQDQISHLSQPK